MMKICEAKIFELEEEYLENTLHRHGNVFNAWKEIKQDKSRFGSITDKQQQLAANSSRNLGVQHQQKNRQQRTKDKDKDKEKIYKGIIQEEIYNREKSENLYKFNFVELAQKMGQTKGRKIFDGGSSGNLTGSKETNGKAGLQKKPSQINMIKNDSTSAQNVNTPRDNTESRRKSSRIGNKQKQQQSK